MATLSVIYKIASDISGLQDGVNKAAKSLESLDKSAAKNTASLSKITAVAGTVGRALAGAFTIGAIVASAPRPCRNWNWPSGRTASASTPSRGP
jgi:hypothetical protein